MTRENKLALIIGFGLVLVVGILVSDHFSAAASQKGANLARSSGDASEKFVDAGSLTPVEIASTGNSPRMIDLYPTDPAMANDLVGPDSGNRDVRSMPPPQRNDTARNEQTSEIPDVIRIPDLQKLNQPTDAYKWHTIKSGETLSKIAAQYYGEASLWRELAAFNKDRIPNPNNVSADVTIRIPTRQVLLGGGRPAAQDASTDGRADRPSSEASPQYTEYTVRKGDSLSELAKRFLGSATKYRELYELNRDVIDNPDSVVVGTTIRVPKR